MVALVKQQSPDGSDLLSQYRASGSPEVFAQIMRAYGGMVFSVCLKVTKVPADAEDASQATFLTLAVQCKTGAVITYLGPWLKKVAKRSALDLVRSRKRRTRRETITAENRPEFYAARACAESENAEIGQIIRAELDELPAKYRMPLVLHYFGGLSHDQISQEMRCTTAALGVRLHRARKMLGKRLTARGINLERGALGAAIVVAIQQVISDRFVHSTQQATTAMAWAHPASAVATLPHSLGDITGLVAQVAASMSRARTRMAALAMAASITMLGGAAEAVRHLPESIRPSLDFLSPSKAIETIFHRITPTLRVDAGTEGVTSSEARPSLPSPLVAADEVTPVERPYIGLASAVPPLAAPSQGSAGIYQPPLAMQVPTPHARPPITPPRSLAPTPYTTQSQQTGGTRVVVVREHAPVPLAPAGGSTESTTTERGRTSGGRSSSESGTSSGEASTQTPAAVPPPMLIPPATSEQRPRNRIGRFAPTAGGSGTSFNLSPDKASIGHFTASATDGQSIQPLAGPILPDFSQDGLASGGVTEAFLLDSGDRLVHSGSGTYQWDDVHHGIAFGGVNSATVSLEGVVGGGVLSIEHLSPNTTRAPARPDGHTFIGIWEFDAGFSYDALSLSVRYDDALAQSLGLKENLLKLWVHSEEGWTRLTGSTFYRNLDEHTLHGAYYDGAIDFFAVSAPEPGGIVSVLALGGAALLRRRRRRV